MNIKEELRIILANIKQLDPDKLVLNDDDDFMMTCDMDSLDAVELTIEIGEHFGFTFGENIDDIDALQNFGKLVELISRRGVPKPSS